MLNEPLDVLHAAEILQRTEWTMQSLMKSKVRNLSAHMGLYVATTLGFDQEKVEERNTGYRKRLFSTFVRQLEEVTHLRVDLNVIPEVNNQQSLTDGISQVLEQVLVALHAMGTHSPSFTEQAFKDACVIRIREMTVFLFTIWAEGFEAVVLDKLGKGVQAIRDQTTESS